MLRRWLAELSGPLDTPVSRSVYLRLGASLMALKYLLDAALVGVLAGVLWTPSDYLVPMVTLGGARMAAFPQLLNMALLICTLPFIWIGVTLSVRRALDAGLFPGFVVAFFIPFMNYALMLVLALAPTAGEPAAASQVGAAGTTLRRLPGSAQAGIVAGAVSALLALVVSFFVVRTYGASVFLGVPFTAGAVSAFVASRAQPRTRRELYLIGQAALALTGCTLMLFAVEGVICLAMAVPIAVPLALMGSFVGGFIARREQPPSISHLAMLLMLAPMGAVIEAAMPDPAARMVLTAIEIDAPPAVVWTRVVSFSDIVRPPGWLFRTGLAYPLRARIDGRGVGAVRHCEFTTGAFREPITVWDEPRTLAFDVAEQPPPLQEWSPYSKVYAPHLDGFFRTTHGEFRLVALAGNRTRLEGRTWYTLRMQPARYWEAVADAILHEVHARVLEHVKSEAEQPR